MACGDLGAGLDFIWGPGGKGQDAVGSLPKYAVKVHVYIETQYDTLFGSTVSLWGSGNAGTFGEDAIRRGDGGVMSHIHVLVVSARSL